MMFSFGQSGHDRVAVDVVSHERPLTGEYWDDNWLVVEVSVHAGGFQGKTRASIQTSELAAFGRDLRQLYDMLSGTAEFTTIEEQLHLILKDDGKGHITLKGEMMDQPGIGRRLKFNLEFDQSQLANSIRDLSVIIAKFPVRSQ
jgi:hypothetical protein